MNNDAISKHHLTPIVEVELWEPLQDGSGGVLVSFLDREGCRVSVQLQDTALNTLAEKLQAYSNRGQ